ncbi:MAG: hypothetical protein ACREFE_06105 [Limisphaerales bacterium]
MSAKQIGLKNYLEGNPIEHPSGEWKFNFKFETSPEPSWRDSFLAQADKLFPGNSILKEQSNEEFEEARGDGIEMIQVTDAESWRVYLGEQGEENVYAECLPASVPQLFEKLKEAIRKTNIEFFDLREQAKTCDLSVRKQIEEFRQTLDFKI